MAGVKGRSGRQPNERRWRAVIEEIAQERLASRSRLQEVARVLFEAAEGGDIQAIKEIGDRLDGKAAQQILHSGDDAGDPIRMIVTGVPRASD